MDYKKLITKTINRIKTYIVEDGGDIQFVSFDPKTKTLTIKFSGACVGCTYFLDTFAAIQKLLLAEHKFIKNITFINK